MGPRMDAEAHSQAHGHVPVQHHSFHNAFSQSPSGIVEKLVKLKNSDPELFSEAWNRIPGSVRENILSYLKKYPNLLEKEYPLLLLHQHDRLSKDEIEGLEGSVSTRVEPRGTIAPEPSIEYRKPHHRREPVRRVRSKVVSSRRLEQAVIERSVRTAPTHISTETDKEKTKRTSPTTSGNADSLLLAELRKISRQNKTQIELMRRLVQTSRGNSQIE